MKTFLALTISVAALFAACNNAEVTNKVEATDPAAKTDSTTQTAATPTAAGDAYVVQKERSVIHWKGSNKFTPKFHPGTLQISDGSFSVADGQVTGGKFTADMNTIAVEGNEYTEGEKGRQTRHPFEIC